MGTGSKKSKRRRKWLKAKIFDAIGAFEKKHKDREIGPYLEKAVKNFERDLVGEAIPAALTIPLADDPEGEIVSLNFRAGSLESTEMFEAGKEVAKALVHKLCEINSRTKSRVQQTLIKDKVPNQNEYAFLYKNLSPDVEILEIRFADTGRIFGFFTQATFNIVCVRVSHVENH